MVDQLALFAGETLLDGPTDAITQAIQTGLIELKVFSHSLTKAVLVSIEIPICQNQRSLEIIFQSFGGSSQPGLQFL